LKVWVEEHPLAVVFSIWLADIVFVVGGSTLLSALFPNMPGYGRGLSQSLVLVLIGVGLVAGLLTALGWWQRAGFVGTAEWRNLRVLWLPVLFLLVPFVRGVRPMPANELLTLVIAYAATAFFEEAIYRGMILGLLRPRGVWPAVILSSLLFGLVHLSNIALRGNPGLIALQALGAATGGVGMAAIRVRTRTIWPGIGLHAAHDLFFQLSYLPVPLVDAANSIFLLVYGIYILRPSVLRHMEPDQAEQTATAVLV